MKDKHATVKIGEYTIPLIGIAESATQQKCSRCKCSFHLSEITLNENGKPLCKECLKKGQK